MHFTATGYFPTNTHLFRPIPKESVRIETRCCIFKRMIIDWTNTEVTGISGIRIEMPSEDKISIFTDNDLTHITDDHFEIKLTARLLDQIYVVPSHQSPLRYDDTPSDPMSFTQTVNNTGSLMGINTDGTTTHANKPYLMNKYIHYYYAYDLTFTCIIEF